MGDTYDVLQPDGSVREFRAEQFEEIRRVRTHAEHDSLLADGWLALDEEIEAGDVARQPAALEQAFTELVVPPPRTPEITVYVLGRLKEGEQGKQVV